MFINRKSELAQLHRLYESDHAELYVLYGRRRVGKTELLRTFCIDKPNIFFIATLSSDSNQLASFSQKIYQFIHKEVPEGFTYPSWDAAFQALAELPVHPRPVVILDEFTYLMNGNKAIPSILQKVWDEKLKDTQLMIILCGSYIGMMETEVLGYRAPLYGRRTASTLLKPLDFPSAAQFFPAYSPEDKFLTWAILGGMPYYLNTFADKHTVIENIRQHIVEPKTGTLYNEPRLLLMEELREPRNYFSILRAIAQGNTRVNEIAQSSGVGQATTISRYLDILQQIHLVTRRVPATENQPEKSKKGLYQIDDHFLRFWFRYVHPNQSSIDLGLTDAILEQRIKPDLDHFAATSFEEASRTFVAHLAQTAQLTFIPQRIGAWWNRTTEIDVLAISHIEKAALFGECKWSINKVGINVLEELKQKSSDVIEEYHLENIQYVLFSRIGFTSALLEQAEKESIMLFTVDDLVDG